MMIFLNGKPEEFLLFQHNVRIMLNASRTITANVKNQDICMFFVGDTYMSLRHYMHSLVTFRNTNLNHICLGIAMYFFSINELSKQTCVVHCRTRKLRLLKFSCYEVQIIQPNYYLDNFMGSNPDKNWRNGTKLDLAT